MALPSSSLVSPVTFNDNRVWSGVGWGGVEGWGWGWGGVEGCGWCGVEVCGVGVVTDVCE